jgi:ubiquinone/menaquinone biosynthesis C-methylase UbiE
MSQAEPAAQVIQCAPAWTQAGTHGMSPLASHDEIARFNFLANLNKYMASVVVPGLEDAYRGRAKPRFAAMQGHAPRDRREIRKAMHDDPYYQLWSSLRRSAMEMRQQAGRSMVLRQAEQLRDRAAELNGGAETLQLDPTQPIPRYQSAIDNHCMPGSYYAEYVPGDVSAAANYDAGMFATTTGLFGRYLDGAGRGIVQWLGRERPDWRPARILDLGCGLGHNTVPIALAFPEAAVTAIDLAAPMLRYGHARARSLHADNIVFRQGNAERIPFGDASFDLVVTTMFLHETSHAALPSILREVNRVLASGGTHVHLEQPPYREMPIFEQFLRDWDCYYNNEPFWTTLHDMSMTELMSATGFAEDAMFETEIHAVVDWPMPKVEAEVEDFGRGGMWYAFGSHRAAG